MPDSRDRGIMEERAKELFYQYHGNRFYMDHDGVGREYESYHISKETEEKWTEEFLDRFLEGKARGREALRDHSAAADLLRTDRKKEAWDICLYDPLRAEHLDDVTRLFMLPVSFRMAERAAAKHCFSAEEAEAYLRELANYSESVLTRAKNGTLTRAKDYVMQEFSDPGYTADYLRDMKKKWEELFH